MQCNDHVYPCKWVLSFRYISRRLKPLFIEMPEPRSSSSRSSRVVWLAWIFWNSCLYPWKASEQIKYHGNMKIWRTILLKALRLEFLDGAAECVSYRNQKWAEYPTFCHWYQKAKRESGRIRIKSPWIHICVERNTLSSICSISMDSESKTCSLRSGAVSADVLGIVDVPILL